MITPEGLGRRLRLARSDIGFKQEEVAARFGVPRPTISQIEAGKRGVGGIELARFAELYRRPVAWFVEDPDTSRDMGGDDPLTVLFRASELRDEDHDVVRDFERLCRAYGELERLLERYPETPLAGYGELGEPRSRLEAIRQGERVALEERRRLGIGDDPIRDVSSLLEDQGVRVFVRRLKDSAISGVFMFGREIGPCILINAGEHRNRLAFNAAHEYGHVLLDRNLRARVSTASRWLGEPEDRTELLEVRANSFAAAFLLPAAGTDRYLRARGKVAQKHELDVLDVLYLHRSFGVSFQAALYRLQNLGWLDRGQREALARHQPEILARRLRLDVEPDPGRVTYLEGGYPARYVSLAMEAYTRAKISLRRLAELLGRSAAETRALVTALDLRP